MAGPREAGIRRCDATAGFVLTAMRGPYVGDGPVRSAADIRTNWSANLDDRSSGSRCHSAYGPPACNVKEMYYLLQPSRPMQVTDIPSPMLLQRLRENPALAVERLEWEVSTRVMDDDVLRVALSHGARCTDGLLVYLDDLVALEGGDDIRRKGAAFSSHQGMVAANDDVLEQLVPGWTPSRVDPESLLDESMEQSARDRDQWRDDLLATSPIPELADHWRSLGGTLPTRPDDGRPISPGE